MGLRLGCGSGGKGVKLSYILLYLSRENIFLSSKKLTVNIQYPAQKNLPKIPPRNFGKFF